MEATGYCRDYPRSTRHGISVGIDPAYDNFSTFFTAAIEGSRILADVIVLHSNNSDTLSMVYTSREREKLEEIWDQLLAIYEWHGGIARGYDINTWLNMCLIMLLRISSYEIYLIEVYITNKLNFL